MYELIVAAILSLPVYKDDAGDERKREQLTLIARAVDEASSTPELEALLLTVAYHESGYSLRIHAGECRPLECDHGRAKGLWQLHRTARNHAYWNELDGLGEDRTRLAAKEAAAALVRARGAVRSKMICRDVDPIQATLSVYAGRRCDSDWKGLAPRMRTYRWLLGRLTARPQKR